MREYDESCGRVIGKREETVNKLTNLDDTILDLSSSKELADNHSKIDDGIC